VPSTKPRWKRWTAIAVGLIVVYTMAGFWLVPALIKYQVPKLGQSQLARPTTIGEVRFNPYTLRLEAQNLRLSEVDGGPLFAVGKLAVEFQWRSLIRRAWSFAEIRVSAPSVSLTITPEGRFNIADFAAGLARRPSKPSPDASLPRLIIERFALEQGTVVVDDRKAGYASTISPIDFGLSNFNTLPEQAGTYTFGADSEHGAKLRWQGELSLNPIRGSGELSLEQVSLAEVTGYLKPYMRAAVTKGQLSLVLPYRFSYADGKLEASLASARLGLRDLALTQAGASDPFVILASLDISEINADLAQRQASIGEFKIAGGKLSVQRDAQGEIDLAHLMLERSAAVGSPAPSAAASALAAPAETAPPSRDESPAQPWKLELKQLTLDQVAVDLTDATVSPALKASADQLHLKLQASAELGVPEVKLNIAGAEFSLADLVIASGARTPFKIAQLGFADGSVDLGARRASLGRAYASGGELQLARSSKGRLDLLDWLPGSGAGAAPTARPAAARPAADMPTAATGSRWITEVKRVELSKFGAAIGDQGSGVKIRMQDFALNLEGASSDLNKSVKFDTALSVDEGGQLSAQGQIVPASGVMQANVALKQLALAPLQPLLSQYVKLKIARGTVSAQGQLSTGTGQARSPALRYVGGFDIADFALVEEGGADFAQWRNVGAAKLAATLNPNLLEIPELRLVEPHAKLIINDDRSLNAARLLVQPGRADEASAAAAAADSADRAKAAAASGAAAVAAAGSAAPAQPESFPVRIPRVRFQNAKLDFTDLSLRPQFAAKIYELNGVVNGLSSSRVARSQIELDGRVDEFGLVRIRGELNPFAPRDNTDVSLVFKNVDMVSATPYAMKFAGYKISEGKISLDLQYKVRESKLEGANQIVIDKLTLGERVDSPDALKLPLELAIAIIKDSDGRIDLGLPVSGDMSNPEFSYGAIIWKAIGNVLTKIVTAPFRALGAMFGISGADLESIEFDAGSDRLLPPEREKLKQVAKILAKRPQLKLSVPGGYSDAADGAALRTHALRTEIAARSGRKLEAGEDPGPIDFQDDAVRGAVRSLYAERFGVADLAAMKMGAEMAAASSAKAAQPSAGAAADGKPAAGAGPASEPKAAASKSPAAATPLAGGKGAGVAVPGEPQIADASAFYAQLRQRLEQEQPLAADAITVLGARRAGSILAALTQDGVAPASVAASPPASVDAEQGKTIPLKLVLSAK